MLDRAGGVLEEGGGGTGEFRIDRVVHAGGYQGETHGASAPNQK